MTFADGERPTALSSAFLRRRHLKRIYLHSTPLATWEDVSVVKVINDGNGQIGVAMTFEPAAASRMTNATAAHLGKPLAILLNYACHPVVFGPDNLQYSADFPGVTEAVIERELGGQAMFLQGGDGDINPFYAVHPLDQDAPRWKDWTGDRLGREAVRVARGIHTEAVTDARLDFAEDVLEFRPRWSREPFLSAVRRDWGDGQAAVVERWYTEGMLAPVATILINKSIAFMTVPGEPFVDYQIDWRNRCPVRDAFFLGYANAALGYFPTIRAASLGGYGAGNMATAVQPDAGARIVDHAIVKVYEMLGKLTGIPEELREKGQD